MYKTYVIFFFICLLPCLLLLPPGFYGTFWCKRKAKKIFDLTSVMAQVCSSLNKPLDITYNNGSIYVVEYGARKLSCIDLDYSMVYNPSKLFATSCSICATGLLVSDICRLQTAD